MNENILELIGINKAFGNTEVLNNINLSIKKNEFVTFLGPSGCGKTTTLRIIGGFENPTSGELLFEGQSILNLPPHKRKLNTVFQKYALFTNMNVFENIAFGLKIKKLDKGTITKKVSAMLKLVNLEGYETRDVSSLSGGQQQRIAIARALVNEPQLLLLDEPLGALDLKLRKEMQLELKNMQQKLGITFIYVTHDQEEALTMSDVIVVMNKGKIQQMGTPVDIYNEPINSFVAEFIGESNIVNGIMHEDYLVEFENHKFKCVDKGFKSDELVNVVIRPEDVDIVSSDDGMLKGIVKSVTFKGVHYEMIIDCDGFMWKVHSTDLASVNSSVGLVIEPDEIHIMHKEAELY